MEINLVAVLSATAAMFGVGAFWYMVPFSKAWGEIHGFYELSKKEQKEMQAQMGPYYGAQMAVTFISAWALAYFIGLLPNIEWYVVAFWLWFGFIVPTEVSAVIFGGDDKKWLVKKIAISVGGGLAATLVGAWVISLF